MIRLDSVTKTYGDTTAVRGLSLEVNVGETCVLVGPSGCGKTTTLKMINRLVEPTSGHIYLDDEDVTRVDPVKIRRRMGYVIQQVGLFPHLDVAGNVATVPRLLGWSPAKTRSRVDELLDLVGLDPASFRHRYPHQLSGGERQRVGVARALGADPPVLLMDEPFGAIDPITRGHLQSEFLRLQETVRKTVVFVTHDIDEAVRLGDRIAIMRAGVLEQYAPPSELLAEPASDFVADFVGADRGLKLLAVTGIDTADLEKPPVIPFDAPLADARRVMDEAHSPWAIVLDAGDDLSGYVSRARCEGEGRVGERVRRIPAYVERRATLKEAFSEMVLHDAGWVVVLDGERYVGVLTPDTLFGAVRRSMADGVPTGI